MKDEKCIDFGEFQECPDCQELLEFVTVDGQSFIYFCSLCSKTFEVYKGKIKPSQSWEYRGEISEEEYVKMRFLKHD